MAPIKFEENIKDKLDKRTLQPSSDAWNKLAMRLDVQEKKKTKNRFWWFGIAASIVGIVFISSLFFNTKIESIDPTLVDIKTAADNSARDNVAIENMNISSESENNQEDIKPQINSNTTNQESFKIVLKTTKLVAPKKSKIVKEIIVVHDTEESNRKPKETSVNSLSFEDIKIKEAVVQIKNMKKRRAIVTDKDIDKLLQQAEKDIFKNKSRNESAKTVNANNLLQDVEADLEQSFRTKVFETLKNSYDSVKTAVANRNN